MKCGTSIKTFAACHQPPIRTTIFIAASGSPVLPLPVHINKRRLAETVFFAAKKIRRRFSLKRGKKEPVRAAVFQNEINKTVAENANAVKKNYGFFKSGDTAV